MALFSCLYFTDTITVQAAVIEITAASSSPWTAPAGVTSVVVECWGGGGGGAGDNDTAGGGVTGGGGGAYARATIPVTPANTYSFSVGSGGTVGSGSAGGNGGDTTFTGDSSVQCAADGGLGGSLGQTNLGAMPGLAELSVGDVKNSGGFGTAVLTNTFGGAGGGSGGFTHYGHSQYSIQTAASAVEGGGIGGGGGDAGVNGAAGNFPGGGGGGSGNRSGGSESGGVGAAGLIRITYNEFVTITGTLYQSDRQTPITGTKSIKAYIGTSTPSYQATTTDGSGNYSLKIPAGHLTGGETVVLWVDGDTVDANHLIRVPNIDKSVSMNSFSTTLSGVNLYQNHVNTGGASGALAPVGASVLSAADLINDTDLLFNVSTSSAFSFADLSLEKAVTASSTYTDFARNNTNAGGDMYITPDGSKLIKTYQNGTTQMTQFNMATPWDLSTLSLASQQTFDTNWKASFAFASATKMYMIVLNNRIYEHTLSTPWDVSTAVYGTYTTFSEYSTYLDISFSPNGSKMYLVPSTASNHVIAQYNLSTAWNPATATFVGVASTTETGYFSHDITFSADGKTAGYFLKKYNSAEVKLVEFTLSTAYDFTTITASSSHPINTSVLLQTAETGTGFAGAFFATSTNQLFVQTTGNANSSAVANDNMMVFQVGKEFTVSNGADLLVSTSSTFVPQMDLNLTGDYYALGTTTFASSTVRFTGTNLQTATGTMTGVGAFQDVFVTNTSGSDAQSDPSVVFGTAATFNNFTATSTGTKLQFAAGATTTFTDVDLTGTAGDYVYAYSTNSGTQWNIDITGTSSIDYVYVKDSNACSSSAGNISTTNSVDSGGNNSCWDNLTAFSGGGGYSAQAWNATDWTLYDTITIESDNVDDDLTDFPVYVDLSDLSATFWSTTPSSSSTVATDIRVTTNDGSPVELPRELVFASSTAQTGELHFKANSISSTTDTTFRVYYNGTTTGDYATSSTYGAQNVWTNDYRAVWHFQQNLTGATDEVLDSTANGYHGTSSAMDSTDVVAGKLGGNSYSFGNSTNELINMGDPADGGLDFVADQQFTVSFWGKSPSGSQDKYPIYKRNNTGYRFVHSNGANNFSFEVDEGAANQGVTVDETEVFDDTWRFLAGGRTATELFFYNNLSVATTADSTLADLSDVSDFYVGSANGLTNTEWDGEMDEVRLASTSRSTAWLKAEYYNQDTTTNFYTVNLTVATPWNATNWTNYDTITIESDNITDDLTDFPVYVDLSDLSATFWSTTPSASSTVGSDIRVTTDDGSPVELPRELVFASSTAQTGELWFKADSISSTTDTTFRIYYNGTTTGDYANDATYGAENVWSNNYVAVWHMQEQSGTIYDSTQHDNYLDSVTGSPTYAQTGKLGNAVDFSGTSQYFSKTGGSLQNLPTGDNSYTIQVWHNPDVIENRGLIGWGEYGSSNQVNALRTQSGTGYRHYWWSNDLVSSNTLVADQWYSVVADYDQTTRRILQNGSVLTTDTPTNNNSTNTSFTLGVTNSTEYWDGSIDEARISSTSRSTGWLEAEYYNQSTTTDFYTVNQATDISSAANQTFYVGGATTTISTITITDNQSSAAITAANDIRIAIATSSVAMKWDTFDTTATLGGTASGKVSGTVSYAGDGSVLVLDVTSNFAAGDTLTIAGLSFAQFTADNVAFNALTLHTDGDSVGAPEATDDKTVTIVDTSSAITITGTLYENDGTTPITTTRSIVAAVATSTVSLHATTTAADGSYSIGGINTLLLSTTTPITIYVNNDTNGNDRSLASTLTYAITGTTGTSTMSGMDLYADTVIINNATGTQNVTFATTTFYDYTDDTNILFDLDGTTATVTADLLVAAGTTLIAPTTLLVDGDFVQQGTFNANGGTFVANAELFDLSRLRYRGQSPNAGSNIRDLFITDDGTKLFMQMGAGTIKRYSLSTAWQVDTASLVHSTSTSLDNNLQGLEFSPDGSKMYLVGVNSDMVYEYDLSTAWDLTTAAYSGNSTSTLETAGGLAQGINIRQNGTKMYLYNTGREINEYDLTTPYDVSTAVHKQANDLGGGTAEANIHMTQDGTYLFLVSPSTDSFTRLPLGAPFDISTIQTGVQSPAFVEEPNSEGLTVSADGQHIYATGWGTNRAHQYDLDLPQVFGTTTNSLVGASAFSTFINDSETGLTFGVDASSTAVMTITTDAATTTFSAGSTYTFDSIDWQGVSLTDPVILRSSEGGTQWNLDVTNSPMVTYVDVKDSDATLTTGGVEAQYSIDSGNNTNWNFLSPATWNATDWTLYDIITIDAANITADLTDFPVYVDLSDLSSTFWSTTPSGASLVGTDIRVTTDDGSPVELPRELVVASSTTQTGELWFKANSISSTTDTVFRIYYNGTTTGDYDETATYGTHNVWTSSYAAVWHFTEDPSSSNLLDSTRYSNDATMEGSMTSSDLVAGHLGYAIDFDGDDDAFDLGSITSASSLYNNGGDFTISSTLYNRSGGDTYQRIFDKSGGTNGDSGYAVWIHNDEGAGAGINNSAVNGQVTVPTNVWSFPTWIFDDGADQIHSYINTSSTTASSFTASIPAATTEARIGTWNHSTAREFSGIMDELRIATTTRSDAWVRAEYYNQSTTTDFYTAAEYVVVTGSSTIANHDSGQVSNAFSFQNKTNEALFAFKLTPNSGNATVTDMTVALSGAKKITTTDFSNIRLYRDTNNDAAYDGGDVSVAGTGSMSLSGQSGSVTFTTDFAITAAANYILVADWNAQPNGSFLVFDLLPSDVTIVDDAGTQTVYGSVDDIQHSRNNRGGGGNAAEIGGAPPATTPETGGGSGGGGEIDTNTGGATIGNATGFFWPTANSGSWTNASNAYDQVDGTYATDNAGATNNYTTYGFGVPGSNQITGIEVKMEISGTTAAGTIGVELSWNNGSSWTSSKSSGTLTTTDAVVSVGGSSDLWGRTWNASEFSNANFAVRLTGSPSSNTVQVDAIQVRVYHQTTGGGGGGGGEI